MSVVTLLVFAMGWPYLGVALHPMRHVPLEEWWIGVLNGIPGGLVVQVILAVIVQSLAILGVLELLARRRGDGGALVSGDLICSSS